MNVSKGLVVVAHPDDEVLGAGGTILRVSEAGGQVTVLVVSEGTSAQYPDDPNASRKRHEQLQEACEKLGVHSVEHWDYPDMRLDTVPHLELNARLLDFVRAGGFGLQGQSPQ